MDNKAFDQIVEYHLSKTPVEVPQFDIMSDDSRSLKAEVQRGVDAQTPMFHIFKTHAEKARNVAYKVEESLAIRTQRLLIDKQAWNELSSCLIGVVCTEIMKMACVGTRKFDYRTQEHTGWWCGKQIAPTYFEAWDVWIMPKRCPECFERIKAAEEKRREEIRLAAADERAQYEVNQEKKKTSRRSKP